ncbi:hypothetical protein Acr_29g0007410 [Actinidia rufa]|uniref:Uncharacterized protein n=1 Tax=Actinidia rufa TaxID=165716 RepID=A0A7J0HET1_9ERIC|nr:hypothetical protein Acr_29g0007410 [Actinidia rufa]
MNIDLVLNFTLFPLMGLKRWLEQALEIAPMTCMGCKAQDKFCSHSNRSAPSQILTRAFWVLLLEKLCYLDSGAGVGCGYESSSIVLIGAQLLDWCSIGVDCARLEFDWGSIVRDLDQDSRVQEKMAVSDTNLTPTPVSCRHGMMRAYFQGNGIYDDQSSPMEEPQQAGEFEPGNPSEVPAESEPDKLLTEGKNHRDEESKDQHYVHPRNYRNRRGGCGGSSGSRGYPNGRGK